MTTAADTIELHPDLQALLDDHFPFVCHLHAARSLAPLAAMMNSDGEISGAALLSEDAGATSVDDAISILTVQMMEAAESGDIRASAIFYHGHDSGHLTVLPAETVEEANCVVAFLDHQGGQAVAAFFVYAKEPEGGWTYAAPRVIHKKPLIFGDGTA